jgi:hypothetical protein
VVSAPDCRRITEHQLADILKGFRLAVRTDDGALVNGEVHVPGNVALHVFRSVGAALREPEPCPFHSGNGAAAECNCELRQYVFRAPETAPADPELAAMTALLPALPLVSKLDPDARERVMDWAKRRACDGLPPF